MLNSARSVFRAGMAAKLTGSSGIAIAEDMSAVITAVAANTGGCSGL